MKWFNCVIGKCLKQGKSKLILNCGMTLELNKEYLVPDSKQNLKLFGQGHLRGAN